MFPPTQNLNLDIEAISGICGSISIACWVVVFSPQIVENFRRGSADGLSLQFIIVWLAGDVFNILGAVLQGVLPTMIILAVYYTLADIVLLAQCFYYRGFTWKDGVAPPKMPNAASNTIGEPNEQTGLLPPTSERSRRSSNWSNVDATHLSPATPLLDARKPFDPPVLTTQKPTTVVQATLFNSFAVLIVCAAGFLGWWVSNHGPNSRSQKNPPSTPESEELQFSLWGQVFGYFCAVLYLGSRVPQILLNYRRKSTEGVSILFFLFACIGNLTYVLSIVAFEGKCRGRHGKCASGEASQLYWRYIFVNASWLAGSLGTLFLDMFIFGQFFLYRAREDSEDQEVIVGTPPSGEENRTPNGSSYDDRPLLQRGDSTF